MLAANLHSSHRYQAPAPHAVAKDEKDFPWNEDLIQAAEAMCREFLTSKGFAVPAAEQPDGKQEKDGGNDDEREKT